MALTAGQRLGIYEVVSAIGKGGMGEVYRARDTKLQREVAIKVLPESLAADRDRLARFEREAQLLAALNHPHIAAIYGVDTAGDTQFLVLELVDGDTLADRITRGGALSLSEALAIARQISEALQAAHDKGIIHRDLKPANIALTADGQVKVLDFGLAKALETAPASQSSAPAATLSPTLSLAMTEAGFILGTAAYMSPEQAKGRPADKRSDVWAFGCVLFEMLTGKRAFEGEDASDTLAGILRGEPDWKALPRSTPPHLREILTGCLTKDRKSRLADISVVSYLLGDARPRQVSSGRGIPGWMLIGAIAVCLGLVGAAVAGIAWAMRRGEPIEVTRFTIAPPSDYPVAPTNTDQQIAVSTDGRRIVYVSPAGLVVRHLDRMEIQLLNGTSGARFPFWSPDGRWIGYSAGGTNELRKVSVTGGPSVMIARANTPPRGASWGPDDTVVFGTSDLSSGLMRVPSGGGEPVVLTKPDASRGETDHVLPSHLPGGRAVLFSITTSGSPDNSQIAVLDLTTGQYKPVLRGGTAPTYVETGHLVYATAGSLRAVRFDARALAAIGDPAPVVEQVSMNTALPSSQYAISRTGTLAYIAGNAGGGAAPRSLAWVSRTGHETPIGGAPRRAYQYPSLSHDNTRAAISIDDQERDIWVFDFAVGTLTRSTYGPALDALAAWYPDDQRFLFISARDGSPNVYSQRADGTGGVDRVTKSTNPQFLPSTSPDGSLGVLIEQRGGTGNDLMLLRLGAADKGKTEPLVATEFSELHPEISPDGRWLAYTSTDSGMGQVVVRPFPDVSGGRWQVSTEGGARPVWSPAGKELFYATQAGNIMAVSFEDSPSFRVLKTIELFKWPTVSTIGPARTYDVSRDGQRFLMIKEGDSGRPNAPVAPISVVLNWVEELKQKLPVK